MDLMKSNEVARGKTMSNGDVCCHGKKANEKHLRDPNATSNSSIQYMVNFAPFWKTVIDIAISGTGSKFEYEILVPGMDLGGHEGVTDLVDVTMLPKVIGGATVTVDKETGEEDEHCSKGSNHEKLSSLLDGITP